MDSLTGINDNSDQLKLSYNRRDESPPTDAMVARSIELLKQKYLNEESTDAYVQGGKSAWQPPPATNNNFHVEDSYADDVEQQAFSGDDLANTAANSISHQQQFEDLQNEAAEQEGQRLEFVEVDMTAMLEQ